MIVIDGIKIGMEFRALNNTIRRYFEFSSHHEEIQKVTGNNKWIIRYLALNEGKDIYQKDIENHFKLARSTVSRVLNLMETKGMIKRLPVPHDGRLKKIILTEETEKIKQLMNEDSENMEKALIRGFSGEELVLLSSFFKRMSENLSGQRCCRFPHGGGDGGD